MRVDVVYTVARKNRDYKGPVQDTFSVSLSITERERESW